MANEEKKGGFFGFGKKTKVAAEMPAAPARPQAPAVGVATAEAAPPVKPAVVEKLAPSPFTPSASASASDKPVDTMAAFGTYCNALAELVSSQLKIAEFALSVVAKSVNKITEGSKSK